MANGLLDFFGKDYEDPRTQGLLQFGLGLMQQGGYQNRPVSLGQAMGTAGQQGMQAYQQAVAEKQRKEQLIQQKAMQDLQMNQMQQAMAAQQEQQELARQERERLAAQRSLVMQGLGAGGAEDLALPRDKAGERPMDTQLALAMAMGEDPTKALAFLAGAKGRKLDEEIKEVQVKTAKAQADKIQAEADRLKSAPLTINKVQNVGGVLYSITEDQFGNQTVSKPLTAKEVEKELGGNVIGAGGKFLGKLVTKGDERYLEDTQGNRQELPELFNLMTEEEYTKGILATGKFNELEAELGKQVLSSKKLADYYASVEGKKFGVAGLMDQYSVMFKSFFDDVLPEKFKKLTPSELAGAIASGQLNGLIGQERLNVVGGGVMTEQDALRVIEYLGGDINSVFNNPQKLQEALTKVLGEKVQITEQLSKQYNQQVNYYYGRTGKEAFDMGDITLFGDVELPQETVSQEIPAFDPSTVPEGVSAEDWQYMSEEDKKLWQ